MWIQSHRSAGLCVLDPRYLSTVRLCIWESLTPYQHLLFYARLKGVPSSFERGLVQHIAELVELDGDPFKKPASSLSGGMKRRLSLGISLIGNPQIWLSG